MTLRANARLAGLAFLIYFISGIGGLVLYGHVAAGTGTSAKLLSIAQHGTLARATVLGLWLECLCAVVLGVTLRALTRRQDRDLALLGMACRLTQGAFLANAAGNRVRLVEVATLSTAPGPDGAAARALGASLMSGGAAGTAEFCFTVGSLIFASLFLRARSIPVWLAWLGVLASILWLVVLPLEMIEFLRGPATDVIGIPLVVFEAVLALWLLIKGIATGPNPPLAAAYPARSRGLAR